MKSFNIFPLHMTGICFLPVLLSCFPQISYGNITPAKSLWNVSDPFNHKVFIENKGQFNGKVRGDKPGAVSSGNIKYAVSNEGMDLYFTENGVTYLYEEIDRPGKKEQDHPEKKEKEKGKKVEPISHFVNMEWLGANPDAQIVAEDMVTYYFTYPDQNDHSGKSSIKASAFKRIIYKNIYPLIDVEYSFCENKKGIKYTFILYPGADASLIRMNYSNVVLSLDEQGNVKIDTEFGNIVDHAPLSFYKGDEAKNIVSSFSLNENTVTFDLQKYDNSQTIIIDPWVVFPIFSGSGPGSAYDVEYDFHGNVYVHGGVTYYKQIKYNHAGIVQWIFTSAFYGHYGDFAVDGSSGSSYIVEGFNTGRVVKLNALGFQIAMFPGIPQMREMWRVIYNNCTHKLIIGGSSWSTTMAYQACLLDTNISAMTAVNVLSSASNEGTHDMCLLAIDNANNCYMAAARSALFPATFNNVMVKCPAATLSPAAYIVNDNHAFYESVMGYGVTNGMNGMIVSGNNLYTYDGKLIQRWNKNTGILINSAVISPVAFKWGGLAADNCGNIYVGLQSSVVKMDTTFTLISSEPTFGHVYDIKLGAGNLLYACGNGFVSSIQLNGAGCNPLNLIVSGINPCGIFTPTVTVSGGTGPYTYSWSTNPVQTTATATGLTLGTYTVIVADASCIPNIDTIIVTIPSNGAPNVNVVSHTNVLCYGANNGSVTVNATGGAAPYTYNWMPSGGTNSSASGFAPGTYTVTVTGGNGCTSTHSMNITQPAPLTTTVLSVNVSCNGASDGAITVTPNGGTGPYWYNWNIGQTAQTITGLSAGTYISEVTDANGCINNQTVIITEPPPFQASITGTNTICKGGSTVLTAGGGESYLWNTGAITPTVSVSPIENTTFSVVVSNGQCLGAAAINVIVQIVPVNASVSVTAGSPAQLSAIGAGPFSWYPVNGLSCSDCQFPVADPAETSTYCVTIRDNNGCVDSACVTVFISVIYIPNAFTPNENNLNDSFKPALTDVLNYKFLIFNRWGEKIFETFDTKEGWNGCYNGSTCEQGAYVYKIIFRDRESNDHHEYIGVVTLVR